MDKVLVGGRDSFVASWLKKTQPPELEGAYVGRADSWKPDNFKYAIHLAQFSPKGMLQYAKRNHIDRVMFASSGIVYHPEWDTEYRQNKIKWEQECLDSGVDVVIARLFTFYGDGLDEHKAISKFTQAAKNNLPIHVTGGGKTIRSYMHGSDLGTWMWAILLNGKSGEAYDVGSDVPTNMFDLACLVRDSCGSSSEIIVSDEPDPMPNYLPRDTAKTRALLTS